MFCFVYRSVPLERMLVIQHLHFVSVVPMALFAQMPALCFLYPVVWGSMLLAMAALVQLSAQTVPSELSVLIPSLSLKSAPVDIIQT